MVEKTLCILNPSAKVEEIIPLDEESIATITTALNEFYGNKYNTKMIPFVFTSIPKVRLDGVDFGYCFRGIAMSR
jgi:hypothetical protein